jgi:hypothetical protein
MWMDQRARRVMARAGITIPADSNLGRPLRRRSDRDQVKSRAPRTRPRGRAPPVAARIAFIENISHTGSFHLETPSKLLRLLAEKAQLVARGGGDNRNAKSPGL